MAGEQYVGPRFPNVIVQMSDEDGNAFAIIGRCRRAARGKLSEAELAEFQKEATAGDYSHLLQTVMRWFEVR
jgi:hypothetical protein